jgi:hypothetical protein
MPSIFWDNAVSFAIYVINRTPTRVNDFKTPLQMLSSHVQIPSVLNLIPKVFGCVVYVHIQKNLRSKLEPCAQKCVFLGFGTNQKGYKYYNPNTKKFFTTMDVTFLEEEYFFQTETPIQGENRVELELSDLYLLRCPENVFNQASHIHNSVPIRDDQNDCVTTETKPSVTVETEPQTAETEPIDVEIDPVSAERVDPSMIQQGESDSWTEPDDEVIQFDQVPHGPRSLENTPEVSVTDTLYRLPPRNNRGKITKKVCSGGWNK